MHILIEREREIENELRKKNRKRCIGDKGRILIKKRLLSNEQKKEIDAVYKKYVGRMNYDFHDFYSQKTGIFSPYYIPDDLYYAYVDTFYNHWEAANYIDNKCYYDVLFPEFRQPETVAKRINQFWYINGEIVPETDICAAVSACAGRNKIFVKQATNSWGGKGVCYIPTADEQEIQKAISCMTGDIIIQKGVTQCENLKKLSVNSVNTVRFLSFFDEKGNVKIYSKIVRMALGDKAVDNASSGGITCGIGKDGRLKPRAFNVEGTMFEKHPATGVVFSDVVLPSLDVTEKLIKQAHIRIPHFRLVSWDIAFDEQENPVLIEANLKDGELDFHQLNNGPLFGDDTEKILDEVFFGQRRSFR
jgi:hypothetical protein